VAVSGRRKGRPLLNALMAAARQREIDCVLVWKFDRFARSTRHLLAALEEFDHLGVRFISVQDRVDTTAGMRAAEARGRHLGRPATPQRLGDEIKVLATSTTLSVRQIHEQIDGRASRGVVGEITRRGRGDRLQSCDHFRTYPEMLQFYCSRVAGDLALRMFRRHLP
jgi:DNA invertase Pin-like site-specific DNA recombinase